MEKRKEMILLVVRVAKYTLLESDVFYFLSLVKPSISKLSHTLFPKFDLVGPCLAPTKEFVFCLIFWEKGKNIPVRNPNIVRSYLDWPWGVLSVTLNLDIS